jgi:hypothetical protein
MFEPIPTLTGSSWFSPKEVGIPSLPFFEFPQAQTSPLEVSASE